MGISAQTLKVLIQELAAFGLDPREWRIANPSAGLSGVLHFEHKEDESFRLIADIGRCESSGLKVHSLQLASF